MVYAANNRLKGSTQKINLVTSLIQGKSVLSAMTLLKFTKNSAAREVYGVLFSAVANAQNNFTMDIDTLFISRILVGKSKNFKRFRARARGSANKISKHFSNIKIFLSEAS